MFSLQDLWLQHALKPTIVHRLPGRLRLRIPALKHLKGNDGDVTGSLEQVLTLPQGIREVSVDGRSGSVLIHYKTEHLSESEIMDYMSALGRLIKTHWRHLQGLDRKQWDRLAPKIKRLLDEATDHRLILRDDIEIPDDVWE